MTAGRRRRSVPPGKLGFWRGWPQWLALAGLVLVTAAVIDGRDKVAARAELMRANIQQSLAGPGLGDPGLGDPGNPAIAPDPRAASRRDALRVLTNFAYPRLLLQDEADQMADAIAALPPGTRDGPVSEIAEAVRAGDAQLAAQRFEDLMTESAATRHGPAVKGALWRFGALLVNAMDDIESAHRFLLAAIETDPGDLDGLYMLSVFESAPAQQPLLQRILDARDPPAAPALRFHALLDLAYLDATSGDFDIAETRFTAARDLARARLNGAPDRTAWAINLAQAENWLRALFVARDDPAQALEAAEAALAVLVGRLDSHPVDRQDEEFVSVLAEVAGEAAALYGIRGQTGASVEAYRQAIDARQRTIALARADAGKGAEALAAPYRSLFRLYTELGALHATRGDVSALLRAHLDAKAAVEALLEIQPDAALWQFRLAQLQDGLAKLHADQGRAAAAESRHQIARGIRAALERIVDPGSEVSRLMTGETRLAWTRSADGEMMAAALKSYQAELATAKRLLVEDTGDLDRQRAVARHHFVLWHLHRQRKEYAAALSHAEAAHEIWLRLAARDPGNLTRRRDLALSDYVLGIALADRGRLDAAYTRLTDSRDRLARLIERDPANQSWRYHLAAAMVQRGDVLRRQARFDPAMADLDEAVDLLTEMIAAEAGIGHWQVSLAEAYRAMARVEAALGDYQAAIAGHRKSREIYETVLTRDPDDAVAREGLMLSWYFEGEIRAAMSDHQAAVALYAAGLELAAVLAEANPAAYETTKATLNQSLGNSYAALGREAEAMAAYEAAYPTLQARTDADPDDFSAREALANLQHMIGWLMIDTGRAADALPVIEASLANRQRLAATAPDDPAIIALPADSWRNLGAAHQISGDLDQANRAYRRSVAVREAAWAADPDDDKALYQWVVAVTVLGQGLAAAGNHDAALDRNRAARDRLVDLHANSQAVAADQIAVDLITVDRRISEILNAKGETESAIAALAPAQALSAQLAEATPDDAAIQMLWADVSIEMAYLHIALGDADRGLGHLETALAIRARLAEAEPGSWDRALSHADIQAQIGVQLANLGHDQAALARFQAVTGIVEAQLAANPGNVAISLGLAESLEHLAEAHYRVGAKGAALDASHRRVEILARLIATDPGNRDWQIALTDTYEAIAQLYAENDRFEESIALYEQAAALYGNLAAGASDKIPYLSGLTTFHQILSGFNDEIGRVAQSLSHSLAAIDHAAAWLALAPDDEQARDNLAHSHEAAGDALASLGRAKEAVPHFRALLNYYLAAPEGSRDQRALQVSYSKLGLSLYNSGDIEAAIEAYQAALEALAARTDTDPDPDLWAMEIAGEQAELRLWLGQARTDLGQADAARDQIQLALSGLDAAVEAHGSVPALLSTRGYAYWLVGEFLANHGAFEQSLAAYRQALTDYENALNKRPEDLEIANDIAGVLWRVGDIHRDRGADADARAAYDRMLAIHKRMVAAEPDNPVYLDLLANDYLQRATLRRDKKARRLAVKDLKEAFDILERLALAASESIERQWLMARAAAQIGDVLTVDGHHRAALEWYQGALTIRLGLIDAAPDNLEYQLEVAQTLLGIGNQYRSLNRVDETIAHYQATVEHLQPLLGKDDPALKNHHLLAAWAHGKRAEVYTLLERPDAAIEALRAQLALRHHLAQINPDDVRFRLDLALSHEKLGDAMARAGLGEQAKAPYQEALAIYQAVLDRDPDDETALLRSVAPMWRLGLIEKNEGKPRLERAREILSRFLAEGKLDKKRQKWLAKIEQTLAEIAAPAPDAVAETKG